MAPRKAAVGSLGRMEPARSRAFPETGPEPTSMAALCRRPGTNSWRLCPCRRQARRLATVLLRHLPPSYLNVDKIAAVQTPLFVSRFCFSLILPNFG